VKSAWLPVTGGPPCDLAQSLRGELVRANSQGFSPPLTGIALARGAPFPESILVLVFEEVFHANGLHVRQRTNLGEERAAACDRRPAL
jgi:hypothetical protein